MHPNCLDTVRHGAEESGASLLGHHSMGFNTQGLCPGFTTYHDFSQVTWPPCTICTLGILIGPNSQGYHEG